MPVPGDTIVTVFKGDTRELDRAFQHGERRGDQFASRLNQTLGRIGSGRSGGFLSGLSNISNIISALPAVGTIARALVTPLTDAAEAGIEFNATLESARIGFKSIIGDSAGVEKHLNQLLSFAEKTPFEFTGLLKSSRYMNTFGFAIDEHIPKLTAWGNALSATGEVNEDVLLGIVRAFGQMSSKGRVSAEEMEQLAERGIPAWELLAKAIGKTVEETRRLAEQGKLKGRPAVEAITAMMEIDPRYKDQMARQSQTFAGRVSNYQDLYARSTGIATRDLFAQINRTMEAGLKQSGTPEAMAGSINAAIAPVAGIVRIAATGLLGGGITAGLTEGIKAGQSIVTGAIADLGLGAISTFKGILGIESPSKVFYDFGLLMGQGLYLGIEDELKQHDLKRILEEYLKDPEVIAFLEMIGQAEGAGYNTMVGGGRIKDLSKHPNKLVRLSPTLKSTAAGRYQFLGDTWASVQKALGLPDFGPKSQDLAAVELLRRRGALDKVAAGDWRGGVNTARKEWASFPGAGYGQHERSWSFMESRYKYGLELAHSGIPRYGNAAMPSPMGMPNLGFGFGGGGQRPVPVEIVDIHGGGSRVGYPAGTMAEMDRAGGFTPRPAMPFGPSRLPVGIAPPGSAFGPSLLQDELYKGTIALHNIGEEVRGVGRAFEETKPGAGEWFDLVAGGGIKVIDSLREIESSIPPLSEQLKGLLVDIPQGVGGILGDAARQWDGTFQGLFQSIGQGFSQMLLNMSAQLMESAVSKFLTQLLGAVIGAVGGAANPFAGVTAGGNSVTSGLQGRIFGFADGGFLPPGKWGVAGERGPEPIYGGKTGMTVIPNGAGRIENHYHMHFQSKAQNSYNPLRSESEGAQGLLNFLKKRLK